MTLASTNIITKGLSGGPAWRGIITTHFDLFIFPEGSPFPEPGSPVGSPFPEPGSPVGSPPPQPPVPPPPQGGGAGGGGYPGKAWNKVDRIQDFYKKVPDYYLQQPELVRDKRPVMIRLKFFGKDFERWYFVRLDRAKTLVRIVNFVNKTGRYMKVAVTKIRHAPKDAAVTVRNVRHTVSDTAKVSVNKIKKLATDGVVKVKNLTKRDDK